MTDPVSPPPVNPVPTPTPVAPDVPVMSWNQLFHSLGIFAIVFLSTIGVHGVTGLTGADYANAAITAAVSTLTALGYSFVPGAKMR